MTRIASHRGGTLEFGDSTPQGFAATAKMPLEEVEFDVHPTADGAIMVHHDATLDGTTDRSGAIAAMSEAEVRAAIINYGAGGHPISLEELCAIYSDSTVNFRCEIKPGVDGRPYENFVPRVVVLPPERGLLARCVFSATHGIVALGLDPQRMALPVPLIRGQLDLLVRAMSGGLAARGAEPG